MTKNKRYNLLIAEADKNFREGNYAKTEELFLEAFKIKCELKDRINYALALIYREKYNLAEENYKFLLDNFSNIAGIYSGYALLLMKLERYQEVIEMASKELDIINEETEYGKKLKQLALSNIAESYYHLEDYDNMSLYARKSLDYGFDSKTTGLLYLKASNDKNYEMVLKYALDIYTNDPEYVGASYFLALAYHDIGDKEKAEKYFLEEVSRPDPQVFSYFYLSLYCVERKEYDKALGYSLKCLEVYKDDDDVWYNLGCIYALTFDYSSAYNCFKASILIDSANIEIMKNDIELDKFRLSNEYLELLKLQN